jgi:hypothetical protein
VSDPATPTEPGWYPNPKDPATERWWNGKKFEGSPRPAGQSRAVDQTLVEMFGPQALSPSRFREGMPVSTSNDVPGWGAREEAGGLRARPKS